MPDWAGWLEIAGFVALAVLTRVMATRDLRAIAELEDQLRRRARSVGPSSAAKCAAGAR